MNAHTDFDSTPLPTITQPDWTLTALDEITGRTTFCLLSETWPVVVTSDLLDFAELAGHADDPADLFRDYGVNIHVDVAEDVYFIVEITDQYSGASFTDMGRINAAARRAADSGSRADAFAVQTEIIEEALGCFEADWLSGLTHGLICDLERRRLGIAASALVWEDPSVAGYGADHWTIRVYDAGERGLMVYNEADGEPYEAMSEPGEMKASFGFISRAAFDSVKFNPYDFGKMMYDFAALAGLER